MKICIFIPTSFEQLFFSISNLPLILKELLERGLLKIISTSNHIVLFSMYCGSAGIMGALQGNFKIFC